MFFLKNYLFLCQVLDCAGEYDSINFFGQEVLVIFACYTTVRAKGIHSPRRIIPGQWGWKWSCQCPTLLNGEVIVRVNSTIYGDLYK